jgi:hypothetical protein
MKLRILILCSLNACLAFCFADQANAQLPIETAIVEEQTAVGVETTECLLSGTVSNAISEGLYEVVLTDADGSFASGLIFIDSTPSFLIAIQTNNPLNVSSFLGVTILDDSKIRLGEGWWVWDSEFHPKGRDGIKKEILTDAGDFEGRVGKNPDVKVNNGVIELHGVGDKKGKKFVTDLKPEDYEGLHKDE